MISETPGARSRLRKPPGFTPERSGFGFRLGTPLLPAIAALALCSGCATHFLRHRGERRIVHVLVDRIGPADEYHVRIRGTSDASLVAGHLHAIEVDGRNVWAGRQIELESLHLELRNLRYHPAPEERISVGESHLIIQLTEKALNDFLLREHPNDPPQITLDSGTVTLKGSLNLLGAPTPLVTTGRLAIVDRTRLVFMADTVHLSDDPVPGIGPAYVESHLNPLLNVGRLNLPLRLDDVEVQPGLLVVRGSISLPATTKPR